MSAPSLAITGATLIDGTGRAPVPGSTIVIENGRFRRIDADEALQLPVDVEKIDASGKYVIPGIMNGNVHLLDAVMMMGVGGVEYMARHEGRFDLVIEEAAQVALREGVTTVFDTYNAVDPILQARDRIARGDATGARIFCAGAIVGMGGPFSADFQLGARNHITTTFANRIDAMFEAGVGHQLSLLSTPEIKSRVRDYLQRGVDFMKVAVNDHLVCTVGVDRTYLTFSPRALRVIVDEARDAGVPVLSHTMSVHGLEAALDLEVDHIVHATLTMQQPMPFELVDRIVKSGTACGVQSVTEQQQQHWDETQDFWAIYGGGQHAENERLLIKSDAPVILNTDAGCTPSDVLADLPKDGLANRPHTLGQDHFLWAEALVQKGMSPMNAILGATSRVAAAYNKLDELGTVEAGKIADLIILDANPLENISNLRSISTVVKDGKVVDRIKLPLAQYATEVL